MLCLFWLPSLLIARLAWMRYEERPATASAILHSAMDINKWLADTAVAVESARRPDQPGYPAETEHFKTTPVLDLQFSKRRAKRHKDVSKDSSILAPEDIPTEVPARRVARQAHEDSVENVPSEDAGYSSQREDEDANPYQRRKRSRTKTDRYDPKPRKSSIVQQDGGKQKRNSAKKVKEAKRPKRDKSAPTVVRNFHAANVPRERLTVSRRPWWDWIGTLD
jgi:hypothetical protein